MMVLCSEDCSLMFPFQGLITMKSSPLADGLSSGHSIHMRNSIYKEDSKF